MASLEENEKRSFTMQMKSLSLPIQSPERKRFYIAQISLRILAIALTLASVFVMITSRQSVTLFGIVFEAKYSSTSASKFLLGANITACFFSLISSIGIYIFCSHGSDPRNYFFVFLHDMMIMLLMISGCAASTAVGYVSRYGESQTGWTSICDRVAKFCNRIQIAILLSYLGFFCFLALTIMSALKSGGSNQINSQRWREESSNN
ncbi:Casparian strip membrane protein domain [Dillenia turbinata]|uniref:CASP-like protein n=1 Tax=Dillenia turbinata TaxID=194707 RepID=A0AAN8Z884_9MAGN